MVSSSVLPDPVAGAASSSTMSFHAAAVVLEVWDPSSGGRSSPKGTEAIGRSASYPTSSSAHASSRRRVASWSVSGEDHGSSRSIAPPPSRSSIGNRFGKAPSFSSDRLPPAGSGEPNTSSRSSSGSERRSSNSPTVWSSGPSPTSSTSPTSCCAAPEYSSTRSCAGSSIAASPSATSAAIAAQTSNSSRPRIVAIS